MQRPDRLASSQGFLLLEAVLSAVVIGLGLSLITRALGGQLGAVRRVEEAETTLTLARGKLLEWEALQLAGLRPAGEAGSFEPPWDAYDWQLQFAPSAATGDGSGSLLVRAVMTTARREPPGFATSLSAVWPSTWAQQP